MTVKHELIENAKSVGDITSVSVLVGTLAEILPGVAALFTIVWTAIRIYETDTIQRWLNKEKKK